jgi:AcrR family transcriptional regulator
MRGCAWTRVEREPGEPMAEAAVKTAKGEQTRALIMDTAVQMFMERGYEETTMRAIAERAGVALGSAYYYFRSKEQLIQAFYGRTHQEHMVEAADVLRTERTLRGRLYGVMAAKLRTAEPYHRFSGVLFRTAADPESPLNPFSTESIPARLEATELFAEVVRGAEDRKIPRDLEKELPELLWMYHMGVILYWIHDRSPGRARTWKLMERTVDLVARLIALSTLPLMGPIRKSVLRLLADLRAPAPDEALSGAS